MTSSVREKYKIVLNRFCPKRIESDMECARFLKQAKEIMLKGDLMAQEEQEYLELIATLINAYEQERYQIKSASPLQLLKFLMEQHQHTAKDLWQLIDKSIISKILNGQRKITIEQAKALGKFYNIGFKAFVS